MGGVVHHVIVSLDGRHCIMAQCMCDYVPSHQQQQSKPHSKGLERCAGTKSPGLSTDRPAGSSPLCPHVTLQFSPGNGNRRTQSITYTMARPVIAHANERRAPGRRVRMALPPGRAGRRQQRQTNRVMMMNLTG